MRRVTQPARETAPTVVVGRRRPIIETRAERYFHNNQAAPWIAEDAPAMVRHRYGRGRVVFAAGSPEGNVARLGNEDHARMLVDAVRWAAGCDPLVRIDGPTTMRVVAGWLGTDLVVHLVTAAPDLTVRHGPDRTLETITRQPRLRDVRVSTMRPVGAAFLEPDGKPLCLERTGAQSSVVLDSAGDWITLRFTRP